MSERYSGIISLTPTRGLRFFFYCVLFFITAEIEYEPGMWKEANSEAFDFLRSRKRKHFS